MSDEIIDTPPASVWMHQERLLGYWFSVADECREEGDVEYMPVASAGKLREALEKAKETIKALHGPVAWDIYDQHSPEMKQINEALAIK